MWQTNDQNLSNESTLYIPQSYKTKTSWQCGRRLKISGAELGSHEDTDQQFFCWEMQANTAHAPNSQPHTSTARSHLKHSQKLHVKATQPHHVRGAQHNKPAFQSSLLVLA